jgi:hypothetical protein
LADEAKSAEIWGALLDAAIPFSLEKCQVVFLPPHPLPQGGLRCLAVAARLEDIQEVLDEWADLGIDPDILLPETLLLPGAHGCPVWLGETRSLFVARDGDQFLGAAGVVKRDQREKALTRFQQAWRDTYPDLNWISMGPEADSDTSGILENALCRSCFETSPDHANLRAEPVAAEGLKTAYRKQQMILKGSLLFLAVVLVLWPLAIRFQLRRHQGWIRRELSETFEKFTGSPSSAPGQELLLAQRFLDNQWGDVWEPENRLLLPGVSDGFSRISNLLADRNLVLSRLEMDVDTFSLNVLGEEREIEAFVDELALKGWGVTSSPQPNGTWRIAGSTRP